MRIPSIRSMSVLSLSILGLASVGAQPARAAEDAPAAVASAESFIAANSHKAGFKLLEGTLQGGGGPVAFSLITIYAAGNSGYGQGTVAGLGFTDQSGKILAVYTGQAAQQLYLVASGGYAAKSKTYDSAITLSAPLGTFRSVPASVTVNETTTVAAAYALSQFLNGSGQSLGTSAGNVAGLNNAVAVFANLANLATGTAATSLVSGALGTPPAATVNTLANILASCIATGSPSSSQCASLFEAATPAGGAAPANTLAAAVDIARNEGNNVAALFALAGTGPFQPALTTAPNDWNVAINYTGGNLDSGSDAQGLAIDAAGNAWVSSLESSSGVNNSNGFVVSISPQGAQSGVFTDNGNIANPGPVAIDLTGNVFIGNGGTSTVSALSISAGGSSLSGSPFTGGGMVSPQYLSIDRSGNVWVLSVSPKFLTELPAASAHAPVSFPVTDGGTVGAVNLSTLAVDNSGNVYAADTANSLLVVLSAADPSQQLPGSPFSESSLFAPFGMAIDESGNLWVANSGDHGVTELVSGGGTFTAVPFTSIDLGLPGQVAMDGAGNAWIANRDPAGKLGILPLSSAGAALAGSTGTFTGGGEILRIPSAVAVDASGNVWVAGGTGHNVVEIVGAAKPVKTPLAGQPQLP